MEQTEAVVVGAGLTGVTAALELARNGVGVTLIEQDDDVMNRASLRNEGKIHLGFVFVHDASLATAKLMIAGACSFRGILARLAGPRVDALCVSRPFVYIVADDSLLAPDEIERRYRAIEALYRLHVREAPDGDYLGRNLETLFARVPLARLTSHLRSERFQAAFETAELAIDTQELAGILRSAVAAEPRIRLLAGHTLESVQRRANGFTVSGAAGAQAWEVDARHVINASWENRFKIDRTVGLEHAPGWLHRLKYRVIARVPAALRDGPSVTMVVGRYGDVVIRPDGTAYFSWYPAGLQGWTAALAPPAGWNAPCRGEVPPDERRAIATALLNGIERWYPGASQSTEQMVDAGAIVAYGASDVDDPASGLHDRTRVGVTSSSGYHSVDPGKLTTAPLFGVRAAQAVLEAMALV
jgi:glycine/D-amino acid oxidase-like deaminating enzyme